MCRSIKQLRLSNVTSEPIASRAEMEAAALQYVRKVTGFRVPSRANKAAFDRAVQEIADATQHALEAMTQPKLVNQ